ncbi:lysophospholipid acyltransferase LPEAT2-like isoform X2 [Salvia splendens]|uniref:lysophospholipid acyltransferase LPEAT2-like isoform X1 n=1 Tax=Salvia splendens TaxID=180675 RepID=UPI001C26FE3C|nr:lysophospholipid acyltransferase LPEAT2-like isoform X1 [Salvia splendens]XP_042039015.1 lysophospholipid acyltransferase LPEAT2-like isoform X2 [Salvia splendens]
MAVEGHSLSAPLLSSEQPPHHIVTVHDQPQPPIQSEDDNRHNPYAFVGVHGGFEVPASITIDPYRNHTPNIEGLYEWFKTVVCLPIAAVRLVLFGLCLMVGYLTTRLALYGWKDRQNPMPRWRCRLMWVTRFCGRAILFSFGYHWIKRKGKPAPREVAPIVVSNHVSYIDPIFFFYELFPTIVSADSHDSMPFVGTIIRAMQVIYVDRFSKSSRKHAVNEIKRKASCNQFPRVLLFPEGTTSNGKVLLSFQIGAFIPGYPVQPVVVRYPYVHFDQSWGNITLTVLMFRMFTQFHNFMEVEYLPLVYPNECQKENAVHFAQRTGRAIASALNVVQTAYSYGDFMIFAKAAELKQENPSLYMVELGWVQSSLRLSALEAVEVLELFLSMNPDPSGLVEFHYFLRALRLKPCGLSEKMFEFIDVQKMGKITFKQFLLGSAHILKQPLFRRTCDAAFGECDINGKGHISKQELQDAVSLSIPSLNSDEIHGLFSLFDVDNDGMICLDDFISCLRRHPLLVALFAPILLHRGSSLDDRNLVEEIL